MQKKRIIQLLRLCVALLFLPAFVVRCASILTPTGGPKDTLPPVITAMTHENFSTRMTDGSKVHLEIDEFAQPTDHLKALLPPQA